MFKSSSWRELSRALMTILNFINASSKAAKAKGTLLEVLLVLTEQF